MVDILYKCTLLTETVDKASITYPGKFRLIQSFHFEANLADNLPKGVRRKLFIFA